MQQPGYRIDTDPRHERLRIDMLGFWTGDTARLFAVDLAAALEAMVLGGARPGHMLAMLDLRDQAVLAQPMVDRFREFVSGPGQSARRVAVLAHGTLQMMHLRRIAAPLRECQFFLLESEAEAWLEETVPA